MNQSSLNSWTLTRKGSAWIASPTEGMYAGPRPTVTFQARNAEAAQAMAEEYVRLKTVLAQMRMLTTG